MVKKKLLVIIPDRFVKSSGGMGANSGPVFEILSKDYDIYVAGFPLQGTEVPDYIKEYREVFSPYTETKHGPVNTLAAQASYFAQAIRFPRPDLVYAFDWSIYQVGWETADFFQVPLVTRMCLSPILLSQEGYTFGLNLNNAAEKALHNAFCEMEIRGLKKASRILHVAFGYLEQYEKFISFKDKARVVHNGINSTLWQRPDLAPFPLPGKPDRKKVVFLGRLTQMKGVIPLCKASIPEGIDLIFIGPQNSAEKPCLDAVLEKVNNNDNVHYINSLYGEDKIRALRSAEALIVPSHHESFGGVALEGLAAGCIVLSSQVGGLKDYLTNETSLYCGTTPETIEKSLTELLNLTAGQIGNIHTAGLNMAKELSIESSAKQMDNLFREVA